MLGTATAARGSNEWMTTRSDPVAPSDGAGVGAPGPLTFEELYRQQYRPMLRLAMVIVDGRDDAEQVVQDAFVATYRRFDRVEHPAAYVRTCVVNGGRKLLRRRRLMRRHTAERPVDVDLGFNHVFDAIRRLPAEQRALIALRYEQQLTDAEIAATLSMPLGTVKSRLHRALAVLRKELS